MPVRNIALFVPCHNEREKLGHVLEHILDVVGRRLLALVVVDDGSTDDCADIAARYTPHVIRHPQNLGNGAATRSALQYIAGIDVPWDAVVRIDGDGQHRPNLLPEMLYRMDRGAEFVLCSRFHPQSDIRHAPPDRCALNFAIASIVRHFTGWPVTDARSGFFGIRWDLVAPIIEDLRTQQYGIPIELLLRVWGICPDARYAEIPHPAMYQRGISERLDQKYRVEEIEDQVERMRNAYDVLLRTRASLRVGLTAARAA